MLKLKMRVASVLLVAFLVLAGKGLHAQECSLQSGAVLFEEDSRLSPAAKEQLNGLATQMKALPNCKVVVQGNGTGTKRNQQLSWARATAIIEYLTDVGNVIHERFIIVTGASGAPEEATFRAARNGEDGPSEIPPPYPQYQH